MIETAGSKPAVFETKSRCASSGFFCARFSAVFAILARADTDDYSRIAV
jgi:hypothetical protein